MLVLIKGAGDLATGTAVRLRRAGLDLVMTEVERPTAVRRTVAFSQCMYDGTAAVEGLTARRASGKAEALAALARGEIPVLCDPGAEIRKELPFDGVVDAILAKRNLGTAITDAPIVLALGPGFTAGVDCHGVVETKRGHDLGRLILEGSAIPNTGVPGDPWPPSATGWRRARPWPGWPGRWCAPGSPAWCGGCSPPGWPSNRA